MATYAMFRDALASGDLERIMQMAKQLGRSVRLDDALRICLLLRDDPERYERACVRWIGRFCVEARNVQVAEIQLALAALDALPAQPQRSMETLQGLCRASRVL